MTEFFKIFKKHYLWAILPILGEFFEKSVLTGFFSIVGRYYCAKSWKVNGLTDLRTDKDEFIGPFRRLPGI